MDENYAHSGETAEFVEDDPLDLNTGSAGKTLEQIGAETIGSLLKKTLADAGVSEAVGFEVVLRNGGTHTILSDSNPILNSPASEVSSVKIKQSADAG